MNVLPVRNGDKFSTADGFSFVEILVSLGILGFVAIIMNVVARNALTAIEFQGQKMELRSLRDRLAKKVDCDKTLAPYASLLTQTDDSGLLPPVGGDCPTARVTRLLSNSGFSIVLRDRLNRPISTSVPQEAGTGIFAGSFDGPGRWYYKTSWNGSSIGVSVARRASGSGWLAARSLSGSSEFDDFANTSFNPLFGELQDGIRLCANTSGSAFRLAQVSMTRGNLDALLGTSPESYGEYQQVCESLCKKCGYVSGWWSDLKGVTAIYDKDGRIIDQEPLPPDEFIVGCPCVK